jgi:hypothetical protein
MVSFRVRVRATPKTEIIVTVSVVFVNIKVIQPNTNYVLAGYDFVLSKDGTVRSMLTHG